MACTAFPCSFGNVAQPLELACEKTDTIEAIAAVGIDQATYLPSCLDGGVFTTNTSSVCDLDAVQAALKDACVGEVECDMTGEEVSALITEHCSGPTAGLQLFARVDCAEETGLDTLTILILILYFAISFGLGYAVNGPEVGLWAPLVSHGIQWTVCTLHAFPFQTEHYFDLTGSITYIVLTYVF